MRVHVSHARYLCVIACFAALPLVAQPPDPDYQVPRRMQLGELALHISRRARHRIEDKVAQLVPANAASIKEKIRRAQLYFPIVERVLKEERVPDAFKYLAIQESALIAYAVSSSNAVGFWQFKYPAANEVGLIINSEVDERMHIEAATRGACRYLKRHNFFFKNWVYAMTAYYTGRSGAEGYVEEKYINKKSMAISRKTHWYVLHFLAHYIVYEQAVKAAKNTPLGMYLHEHKVKNEGSLAEVAKKFEQTTHDLKTHNAWLLKERIPKDKDYIVYIPRMGKRHQYPEKEGKDTASFEGISVPERSLNLLQKIWKRIHTQRVYTLTINGLSALVAQQDDTLQTLIQKGGISERNFLRYNDIGEWHKVRQGNIYYLERKKRSRHLPYHIVQPSESLWHIAQLYGVRLDRLAKKNELPETDIPTPYTKIWLSRTPPKYDPNDPIPPYSPVTPQEDANTSVSPVRTRAEKLTSRQGEWLIHRVSAKENLHSIAEKYGVSVEAIAIWNDIKHVGKIKVGDLLYLGVQQLPGEKTTTAAKNAQRKNYTTYQVRRGDTLYGIARRYKTSVQAIKNLNQKKSNQLRIGEQLRLPAPE